MGQNWVTTKTMKKNLKNINLIFFNAKNTLKS